MNKYEKGKIYRIISESTEKCYIGSTITTLSKRLAIHCSHYKRFLLGDKSNGTLGVYDVLKFSNHKIILIEEYPCNSKEQLRSREQYWIEYYRDKMCNKYDAVTNKEKNRLKMNALMAKKRLDPEYRKLEYAKEIELVERLGHVDCDCGGHYLKRKQSQHFKSITHRLWVSNQLSDLIFID